MRERTMFQNLYTKELIILISGSSLRLLHHGNVFDMVLAMMLLFEIRLITKFTFQG